MIDRVVIRRFKRFDEAMFDLRGSHVVLAGPNNLGKTTALQAIAAWDFALTAWRELNDLSKHNGFYAWKPVARPAFAPVSVRAFDHLWRDRVYREATIEIEIRASEGWTTTMEFRPDTAEQIYVRPRRETDAAALRDRRLSTVFVPAMTGLKPDEPLYARRATVDSLLGQGRPGEILRNLLVEASEIETAWTALRASIGRLFGYALHNPEVGATIVADYSMRRSGPRYDIASAGSGFQQVLMLLTFLHVRPGSVLLLDEPDAHLHVILQDGIWGELRAVAAEKGSQLVIATHSEVIINAVQPEDLYLVFDPPRRLADSEEQRRLVGAMARLTNTDVMLAAGSPGVLYVENFTDLDILREFARVIRHPAYEILAHDLFWKPVVWQPRPDAPGIKAKDHHDVLRLVRDDLPALELTDGDGDPRLPETEVTGRGFQRLRWRRYEIESYLIHPEALARFVEIKAGGAETGRLHADAMREHFRQTYPPAFLRDPLGDIDFIKSTKARTRLLPPALTAGGLPGFPYTRYHEIASIMRPEEVHPEVKEKLDLLCKAFGRA